jgi:hypothetical protein
LKKEIINGGQTVGSTADLDTAVGLSQLSCGLAIAGVAIAIVGFVGTGGIGAMAWVAFAGIGVSGASFVDACH